MRISAWSSAVCSSDLPGMGALSDNDIGKVAASRPRSGERAVRKSGLIGESGDLALRRLLDQAGGGGGANLLITVYDDFITQATGKGTRLECCEGSERSEEHTSELQSLMRISYAVFCLKNKKNNHTYSRNEIIILQTYTNE